MFYGSGRQLKLYFSQQFILLRAFHRLKFPLLYVTLLTHWPLRSLLVILFGYVCQRELQYNRATQYAAARL